MFPTGGPGHKGLPDVADRGCGVRSFACKVREVSRRRWPASTVYCCLSWGARPPGPEVICLCTPPRAGFGTGPVQSEQRNLVVREYPRALRACAEEASGHVPHTLQRLIDFLRTGLWEMVPLLSQEILHTGQAGFSASAFHSLHLSGVRRSKFRSSVNA